MAQFNPQPFGKYYLVDKLAVGGMAEIFLARPPQGATSGPSYLVIKRILPHFSTNAQFIDMFIDEAKISVQLEHENIVPVFDLGKVGETYFLAMQFVAGQDLKAVITRCRDRGVRLSYDHASYIVADLLKGLDYAHKKTDRAGRPLNIVHRDISPQNVLVGYDGSVKITDFGIAKAESKLDSTQVGTLKGKFGYMAPEQVVSSGPGLDHRSDIFAAGIILWELVTGHRLFAGTSEIEILERVRAAKFDPPSSFVPDVPRDLEKIVFKSLMKDRDKRYGSAAEMEADLTRFLESYAPEFNQTEMSAVMDELFAPEIALAKSRWNVVVGPIIDKTKVAEGAKQESTRPDQTRVTDMPIEPARVSPTPARASPVVTRAPTPPPLPPPRGATPPPMRSPPPDSNPRITTARTTTAAPAPPRALRPEDLFDDAGGSPFGEAAMDEPRTSIVAVNGGRASPSVTPPRAVASPVRTVTAPQRSSSSDADPDFMAPGESTTTTETAPLKRSAAQNAAPSERRSGVRPWLAGAFFFVLLGTVIALGWMGVIPNPFAPPVIEVVSTVDALVTIDGNVVLASGRTGTWRVGEGQRTIEVKRAGYQTLQKTIDIRKGQHVFVDAMLVPLPDALADILITSTPPGAQVFVDAEPLDGVTPLTVHAKIGDHTIRVAHEGLPDQVRSLRAGHPGALPAIEFNLAAGAPPAATGTAAPSETPAETPAATAAATAASTPAPITTAKAVPAATRAVVPTVAPVVPTAAPVATAPGDPTKGFLSVNVPGGWGEVYLDGTLLANRTPVVRAPIAPGAHTLRVFNPVTQKEKIVQISIDLGVTTVQRVDME